MVVFAGMLAYVQWGTPTIIFAVILPGLVGFLSTYPIDHMLKKYQPKRPLEYDDTGTPIRMWYDD